MKNTAPRPAPRIQDALSALLAALGFETMAREVLAETAPDRLSRYARIVVKQTRDERMKRELLSRFQLLKLL